MSVLVECYSLILQREMLERIYPGGTDAFMMKLREPVSRCRFVCADDRLVSASFVGVTPLRHVVDSLCALGLTTRADGGYYDIALWNEESESRTSCKWLAWSRHEDGYAMCWRADGEPGKLHAPIGWQANRRFEPDDGDESLATTDGFVLSRRDGVEVTLDLRTGRIEETSRAGAHLGAVRATLERLGYAYIEHDARTIICSMRYESSTYSLAFMSRDEIDLIELMVTYPTAFPADSSAAIAEMTSRINGLLMLGHFELEYGSRNLRYRSTSHVLGAPLNEATMERMVTVGLYLVEHYEQPFMRVAFGGASPQAECAKLSERPDRDRRERGYEGDTDAAAS